MGNYKSRPQSSCGEELNKKIGELHSVLSSRLTADLRLLEPASLSDLQEACCRAEVGGSLSSPTPTLSGR